MSDKPVTLGLSPSFGFGDRTGLATSGHVAAMKKFGGTIKPIFPQQSIREMTRTGRSPQQVMNDAMEGARSAGWTGEIGADADHLKTPADVDRTAAAGFVFFTIDPSEHVDPNADGYDAATLAAKYREVAAEVPWIEQYKGKKITLSTGTRLELSDHDRTKAAVKYGRAINHAVSLSRHIEATCRTLGSSHEIELSIDETPQPTTLAEHYIIADQCLAGGMKLVSLAPRYIGDFEKGVDYKGDLTEFERSLADHAAIAKLLGPYKLSLHSGSDKISIYSAFARITGGMFHVKTAGTSYLEVLRVVARHDEKLFRSVIDFARSRYDTDRATYHVSATLNDAPAPSAVESCEELEELYLETWPKVKPGKGFTQLGRQILHCTFGSVLTNLEMKNAIWRVLEQNRATYDDFLCEHFGYHLKALRAGM